MFLSNIENILQVELCRLRWWECSLMCVIFLEISKCRSNQIYRKSWFHWKVCLWRKTWNFSSPLHACINTSFSPSNLNEYMKTSLKVAVDYNNFAQNCAWLIIFLKWGEPMMYYRGPSVKDDPQTSPIAFDPHPLSSVKQALFFHMDGFPNQLKRTHLDR